MKKQLFTLLTLLVMCVTGAWADSEWIMANWSTSHTGLTYWASGSSADIPSTSSDQDTPAWTDESTYKTYAGTGGASTFQLKNDVLTNTNRVFSFDVSKDDVISVYFMGGGKGDRKMFVSYNASTENRDPETAFGSATSTDYAPTILTATATSAGTVYLWCDANVRVYAIKVGTSGPATAPTITTQPASANYLVNGTPSALTVEATASSGDLSYQWYKNTDQDKTAKESDKITGATSSTLDAANISTLSTGTTYYYVVVKDGQGSTTSNLAAIEVVNGVAPEVGATISSPVVRAGTEVTLTANVNAGVPAPTLQWYTCNSDGTGEESIDGATNNKYVFTPENVGSSYYKVKASNASGYAYSDVKSLNVIAQGVAGGVGDLETITSNYTFIADNHTGSGTVGFTAGYLYDDSRIFSPKGNNNATNKGTSTIDGNTYFNSLRVKSADQDVLVFKVGGPCAITFYTENPGKSRTIKVGNAEGDDSYGTISDANEAHVVIIPAAGTVYMTGSGDRFIAGFKMEFTVTATITPTGYATFSSPYALDFTGNIDGLEKVYYASAVAQGSVTMTELHQTVPAETGLFLKGTPNATVTIPVVATGDNLPSTNYLKSNTATSTIAASIDKAYHYVFAYTTSDNSNPGFFNLSSNVSLSAGKAYLETTTDIKPTVPATPATPAKVNFLLADGGLTGVKSIDASNNSNVNANAGKMYNLGGQLVNEGYKGIVIVNGKKVVK